MDSRDLSWLVHLDALLQESSVSRAAKRVGLSTPAMSHALARIRERFDDPILVRAGRSMVLTERGADMRDAVHDVVLRARALMVPPKAFDPQTLARTFVIRATDYVLLVLGSTLDLMAKERAPGVNLRFVANRLDDGLAVREGGADLAIGIYRSLPPETKTRTLLTDRFVCVLRENHPLLASELTLERLLQVDHVQVAPRGQPGGYIDDVLASQGLRRRVSRAVPYFGAAMSLVAGSDRALIVSERGAERLSAGLGLKVRQVPTPLKPYALQMIWHPRMGAGAPHSWLRQLFVDAANLEASERHPNPRLRLDPGDPTGDAP